MPSVQELWGGGGSHSQILLLAPGLYVKWKMGLVGAVLGLGSAENEVTPGSGPSGIFPP